MTSPAGRPDYAPALATVNPAPCYTAGGETPGPVRGHLDAVTERAAAPIIAEYTGVLAPAAQRTGPPLTRRT